MNIKKTLEGAGYSVPAMAVSGDEAVRLAQETQPHLALMDIKLDGPMDGIECAHKLNTLLPTPTVFLSAYADEEIVRRAKGAAPFGYLIKPFKDRELLVVIEMALYKHRIERELKEAHDNLERQVDARTAELLTINERLNKRIEERQQAEETLRKRETELEEKKHNLEEVNTALKVLLGQREKDKKDFEKNVLSNVKRMILPYLEKMKKTNLGSEQRTYLSIIESYLKEIVTPFVHEISSEFHGLTPTEIQVASLIKEGHTTKEIAGLLHLSENTILTHRFKIRSKLGVKNKKINLTSYLQSFNNPGMSHLP
jgi:DNA-binding NarL/FixJ family response regulator